MKVNKEGRKVSKQTNTQFIQCQKTNESGNITTPGLVLGLLHRCGIWKVPR